ncbi:MAG: chemotaxis protein CheW [Planctomycetes bacterium]|nr:chemotaxis protein CheW [Planctomycetota bacterium]
MPIPQSTASRLRHPGHASPGEPLPKQGSSARPSAAVADLPCQTTIRVDPVAPVLQLLQTRIQGDYNTRAGKAFLDQLDRSARAARADGNDRLTDALTATAADFRKIHDSPLDIDQGVLSIVGKRLGAEFQPPPPSSTAAEDKPARCAAPAADFAPADLGGCLRACCEEASDLFVAAELLRNLHSRMAATGKLGKLVEEMGQLNRDLTESTRRLRKNTAELMLLPSVSAEPLRRRPAELLRGLAVRQANQTYMFPAENVVKLVRLQPTELKTVHGRQVATNGVEAYSAICLGRMLGLKDARKSEGKPLDGVIVRCEQGSLCLLVDEVVGHCEAVTVALDDILPEKLLPCGRHISGVARVDGWVALVLSVPDIFSAMSIV